jgi:hypothetical protein
MSLKVFLTKLRKLRGSFAVNNDGMLRTIQPFAISDGSIKKCLCPIEAVARLLGEPVDDSSLPLHKRTRSRIMQAADENALGGRTGTVRRQMLKVLRLREA